MMIPGAVAGGHKYPPVVSTSSITPVSSEYTQLTFKGRIVRAGNSTNTVVFHYGTSPTLSSYATTSSSVTVANGVNEVDVFITQTNLNTDNAGTTYYYRVVSTNLGGTVLGDIESATVPVMPPTVTTNAGVDSTVIPTATTTNQSGIARFSATLNGTATNATRCYFQYVSGITQNSGYTASVTSPSIAVSLSSGVTYTYRLIAENNSPQVTFNGTVNPNNRSTTVLFRYATTEGGVASSTNTVAGNTPTTNTLAQAVTATISLSAGTYYYRVEATNAGGTSFVTPPISITITNKSVTSGTAKTFTTYVSRSQFFDTPGPATWTYPSIPTGGSQINTINVVLVGGGGGGARGAGKYAGSPYNLAYAGAGGGGGGRRVEGSLTINGNSATLDVGEQGQGASVANGAKSGFSGGTSTITCSATGSSLTALGGIGGVSAFLGAPNGGNSGTTQPGGAGYDAIAYGYSLGGGGAGTSGAGDSATTVAAGKGGPGTNAQCGGGGGAGIYFSSGYLATAAEGRDGGGNGGVAGGNSATTYGGGGGGGASGSGGNGYKGFVSIQWEGP